MVICPGIGNHSEQKYIRTFVDHSQRRGYRCAVLNHLGALPNTELTSPRIFTYGNTEKKCVTHRMSCQRDGKIEQEKKNHQRKVFT